MIVPNGPNCIPRGPKVVPFWGFYIESYKVTPKRNPLGRPPFKGTRNWNHQTTDWRPSSAVDFSLGSSDFRVQSEAPRSPRILRIGGLAVTGKAFQGLC